MAFIVGSVLISAGSAIAGGAIASSGAKKAAKTAAAGSDREIEFNRESRDLARSDQAPYREAGTTALNALMSMTGLGGGSGGSSGSTRAPGKFPGIAGQVDNVGTRHVGGGGWGAGSRGSSYNHPGEPRTMHRYDGGPIAPNVDYNVSEVGPENVYRGGKITRPRNPATIDGSTGYVEPNIQGRAAGGPLDPNSGYQPAIMNTNPNTANSTAINPQTGYPNENPGGQEGGYNFMTDPGYQFRFEEGQRALERGAAAKGGLLSGGLARKTQRYGQGMASNEYSNVYNRISNIAGLGQVATNQSGAYAMNAGQSMGTAAAQGGYAAAAGQQAAGNAWANAGNQIAQMPWGEVFNKSTNPSQSEYTYPRK